MGSPPPASAGTLRGLLRKVPTVGVLATLVGVAYWGHANDWSLPGGKAGDVTPSEQDAAARPTVRFQAPGAGDDGSVPGNCARIEFGSADDIEKSGIDISTVWYSSMTESAKAFGEVSFEPSRVASVSARAAGMTRRVLKFSGDSVRLGETLALIDAPDVGKAKADFQQSLLLARHRERTRDDLLGAVGATSPATLREAEAGVKESHVTLLAAAQVLANLGLPVKVDDFRRLTLADTAIRLRHLGIEDAVRDFEPGQRSANFLPVRSPIAGMVLAADVVTGEVAEAGKPLFVVVDPSRVWVTLHMDSQDAGRVASGQKLFFRPDGGTREHPATVVWVGTSADGLTRSIPVRAQADNSDGLLRASTLGRGRVVLREEPKALVVPCEAIHTFEGRSIIFVRAPDYLEPSGSKSFDVRVVRVGGRDERNAEILAGLKDGEIVAAKGSGSLLEELKRASEGRR